MQWLIDNWTMLVVIAAILVVGTNHIYKFSQLTSQEQINNVKEWLLYAVTVAEKNYGSGTGAIKLRSVYNNFVAKFSWLAQTITFEKFSEMVDEALVEMKKMLETNKSVKTFVEGEEQ